MKLHLLLKNMARGGVLALLTGMCSQAWAQSDAYRSVRINYSDGTATDVVNLVDNLTTTVDGEFLYFHVGEDLVFSTELSMVSGLDFSHEAGLRQVNQTVSTMAFDGSSLSFTGLKAGEQVSVYGVNGMRVASATADSQGSVSISTESLRGVTYVINASGKNFKIALTR